MVTASSLVSLPALTSLAMLVFVMLSGCGAAPGVADSTDSSDDQADTLFSTVESTLADEYTIIATAVGDTPGLYHFQVGRVDRAPITNLAFEWDFGDGELRSGMGVTFVYDRPGIYTVDLTATTLLGSPAFVLSTDVNISLDGAIDGDDLPPVANAGTDQVVGSNTSVFLDGTGSFDPAGDELTFNWTQQGGPAVFLNNADTISASFVAPTDDSELVFMLDVSDGARTSSDSVTVFVESFFAPASVGPIASAGQDQQATEGALVSLNGGQSRATSGGTLTYKWAQVAGSTVQLAGSLSATATFSAPPAAEPLLLIFELTVTEDGLIATDEVAVLVTAGDLTVDDTNDNDNPPLPCATDTDGDGVDDCDDGCPSDATKTVPGQCGCGVSDADSDGDGVPDCQDACPGGDDRIDTDGDGTPDACQGPVLVVSKPSIDFGTTDTARTFTVWNAGVSTLSYTVTDDADWLTVSPASGDTSGEQDVVTATVSRVGLADDNYQATITVTPSSGSIITLLATLIVAPASAGDPQPVVNITRATGVSPLAVFFDATQTTSPSTGAPFHELSYTWDFDDAGSTFRNRPDVDAGRASGALSAHVFELPDGAATKDYDVTLTVRDAGGASAQWNQVIRVTAFAGDTYYVSSSTGDDTWSGKFSSPNAEGTDGPFKTFEQAMVLAAANRRILFKRGDTWTISAGKIIGSPGPSILGAYGAGDKPTIQLTTTNNLLAMGLAEDWRVMDLRLVGPYPTMPAKEGIGGSGKNNLFLRCEFTRFQHGFIQAAPPPRDGVAIVDCDLLNNHAYGMFFNAGATGRNPQHVAIMACRFNLVDTEHLARLYLSRSIISYNIWQSGGKTQMRLLGPNEQNKTEFVILAENHFLDPRPTQIMVQIGAQNTTSERYLENIIFERNTWNSGTADNRMALEVRGGLGTVNYLTIRNNLFLGVQRPIIASGQPHSVWRVHNNSAYRGQSDGAVFLSSDAIVNDIHLHNNVASYPNASGVLLAVALNNNGQSVNTIRESHNTWYFPNGNRLFHVGTGGYTPSQWSGIGLGAADNFANPLFVAPAAGNARLLDGSTARDSGLALPLVFEDVFRQGRPRDGAGVLSGSIDRGAIENN